MALPDARLGGDPPSPWEERYGYSRVVRAGALVFVGGTTSVTADGAVIGRTPYEQTVEIMSRIEHELGRVGARLADIVMTRAFVTDISTSGCWSRSRPWRSARMAVETAGKLATSESPGR
jgi:enamine deaminase RidA (YjgF/YER057c/UK114 family)